MKREKKKKKKDRRSILGKQNEREREKKDSSAINTTQIASEKQIFGQCSRSLIARERI